MNERLTIQDLIDLLAAKHSMTKKDAEAFVKEFFLLIEQALEDEKYLKIKGLGTFKLIDVDSRESVNVNTGERIQIQGHTKVSFTPDANIKDAINKPFSHFETVVLNENAVLEDTPMEEAEEDEAGEGVSAEALENKSMVTDRTKNAVSDTEINETAEDNGGSNSDEQSNLSQQVPVVEEIVIENNVSGESEIEEPVIKDKIIREEIIEEPEEETTLPEITEIEETVMQRIKMEKSVSDRQPETEEGIKGDTTAETIIAQELAKAKLEPITTKTQPETVQTEPTVKVTAQKEKSPVPYLIAVIIIVLLLCGGAILYIYYPDLFISSPNKDNTIDMPVTTHPVEPGAQLLDSIEKKDTVTAVIQNTPKVKEEVPVSESIKKKEVETSSPVYSDSASYAITGTKVTHTVKEGETLTKISLRYFGTKGMWPYIVKHNPEVIKNPDNVPYGTKIKIPELTKK